MPHTDPTPPDAPAIRSLRIAHLTDIHLRPTDDARNGLVRCLRHLHALPDPPDLILNGGDAIMDAWGESKASVRAQWDAWDAVVADEVRLPMLHCIGNHDVWRDETRAATDPGGDPQYGKAWALERFDLESPYYSVDRAGWHLVVLDSVFGLESTYTGKLDDDQFAWLEADLASTPRETPILILSHIPILAACAFLDGDNELTGDWVVPGAWMHIDARRIKDLFFRHPNVRLALSGHTHLLERLDYNGVAYLCGGAVCGRWWNGSYQETPPGYSRIDLYPDGQFTHEYMLYEADSAIGLRGGQILAKGVPRDA